MNKHTGAYWEYIVDKNICILSDEFAGTFEELFALLHPDDVTHTTKMFDDLFLKKLRPTLMKSGS